MYFARAQRQQVAINAIKDKILSSEIFLSPKKLIEVKEVLSSYTETDIDPSAAAIIARRVFQSRNNINSHLLPDEFLENPPKLSRYDNLYVFIPRVEDWLEVHKWVECVLDNKVCK